jgi:predicted nucleic acid-binding Zn ribbon protein
MQADLEIPDLLAEVPVPPDVPVSSLSPAAALEFQAALQLLAERARFLTAAASAAIALEEGGELRYIAVTGDSAPQVGDPVDISKQHIKQCFELQKSVCASSTSLFTLVVPIIRNEHTIGIFGLTSGSKLERQDLETIERLAEMVAIAMDHRDGAAQAEKRIFEEPPRYAAEDVAPKRSPVLTIWHAPDSTPESHQRLKAPKISAVPLRNCASCGFPVSPGRKLCVDCEKNANAQDVCSDLFNTLPQESWLRTHAYTLAMILVTVLTAALVYWLR